MSRTFFVVALSLLFVEFLSAADKENPDAQVKKPKVQVDAVKKENPDAPVKNPKGQPDSVKKDNPDAIKKDGSKPDGVKKDNPDAVKKDGSKPDGVKKDNPDAPVKNPKGQPDGVKKDNPDAVKKEAKPDGDKPHDQGRITKFDVEGSTIKLTVDGKKYAFDVTDNTRAMMKSKEVDGKEIALSLQLYNVSEGDKKSFVKKGDDAEGVKKKVAKPDDVKKPEKKPE